jgi:hypothetical protein
MDTGIENRIQAPTLTVNTSQGKRKAFIIIVKSYYDTWTASV